MTHRPGDLLELPAKRAGWFVVFTMNSTFFRMAFFLVSISFFFVRHTFVLNLFRLRRVCREPVRIVFRFFCVVGEGGGIQQHEYTNLDIDSNIQIFIIIDLWFICFSVSLGAHGVGFPKGVE